MVSNKSKKTVIHHVKKHGRTVVHHVKKHHKKYLFGIIGGAALVKSMLVILASFGFLGLKAPAFANFDNIVFNNITGANLETSYNSNTGVIVNIGTGTAISIENGLYRINTGEWTNYSGSIYSGDILQVQITSAVEYETTTITTVKINNIENSFSVTTLAEEIPEYIAYWEVITGANTITEYISHTGVISGIETGIAIKVENSLYRINTGDWTSSYGYGYSGDVLQMKINSADEYSTTVTGVLYLDSLVNYFIVKTKGFIADTEAEDINFTEITGAILNTVYESSIKTVLGINTGTSISVNNTSYRINGGERMTETGVVYPNDAIQLQLTSTNTYDTLKLGDLFVGDLQTYFSVTTLSDTGIVVSTGGVTNTENDNTDNSTTNTVIFPEIELVSINTTGDNLGFVGLNSEINIVFTGNKEFTGVSVTLFDVEVNYVSSTGTTYNYSDTLSNGHSEGLLNYVINFSDLDGNTGSYNETGLIIFDKTPATIVSSLLTGSNTGLDMTIVLNENIRYDLVYNNLSGDIIFSKNNSEYYSGYNIFATGFVTGTEYKYILKINDYADNQTILTGELFFDDNGLLANIETGAVEKESTLGIFINEVQKFNECKNNLEYVSTDFNMNGFTTSLKIPKLEDAYYKKFVNLLTLLIINDIDKNNFEENQVEFIIKKYENFLVVLKLLKDSDTVCDQNLSNYHITQLQYVLEKYGIIVNGL